MTSAAGVPSTRQAVYAGILQQQTTMSATTTRRASPAAGARRVTPRARYRILSPLLSRHAVRPPDTGCVERDALAASDEGSPRLHRLLSDSARRASAILQHDRSGYLVDSTTLHALAHTRG